MQDYICKSWRSAFCHHETMQAKYILISRDYVEKGGRVWREIQASKWCASSYLSYIRLRTWPICCWIFFLLGLGSRWTERDANLWNEILITYRLIIQTSNHNHDIKDDSLRQDRYDRMETKPYIFFLSKVLYGDWRHLVEWGSILWKNPYFKCSAKSVASSIVTSNSNSIVKHT